MEETKQQISLPDGRQLGFSVVGEGTPVLYFHGTASSRLETLLLKEFAGANGFQIIGVDRPGYGLSTFTPRRRLRDFAPDVNHIMAHLGIRKFALLAWSGGGPFGLTYVALFPECVTKAVIVGSPALPFDVASAHNNSSFARFAMKIPALGMLGLKRFRAEVLKANRDIDAFLKSKNGRKMVESWPEADAKFFADPSWLRFMYRSMAEGFRQDAGVKAVFQEHQLFMEPWAEPISLIPPGKVYVWHGTEDTTCRIDNAYRLVKAVPNASLEVFEGEGHCVMFDNFKKLGKLLSLEYALPA